MSGARYKTLAVFKQKYDVIVMSDRERTYTVRLRIIYNGHSTRLMHKPVCHCNHLYPDYNSRPSKLVATSVTLASFIQPRAVVCVYCAHTEFLSFH